MSRTRFHPVCNRRSLCLSLAAILGVSTAPLAFADPQYVSNCNDAGTGSLRDALAHLVDGDVVYLTQLRCSTITLTSGAIALPNLDVSIIGNGLQKTVIDGNHADRVFTVGAHSLRLESVVVQNGKTNGNGGCIFSAGEIDLYNTDVQNCTAGNNTLAKASGGAIYTSGTVRLTSSKILSNHAQGASNAYGGGVRAGSLIADTSTIGRNFSYAMSATGGVGGGAYVSGNVTLTSSSVSGNYAQRVGGISANGGSSHSVSIIDSTIAGNHGSYAIGGMYSSSPVTLQSSTIGLNVGGQYQANGLKLAAGLSLGALTATMESTIVSGNTSPDGEHDITGLPFGLSTLSGTKNLIGISSLAVPSDTLRSDPKFGGVTSSESASLYLPLLAGSPAIDKGSNPSMARYDQRNAGKARVVGLAADIGSYELQNTGVRHSISTCYDSGGGSLRDTLAHAHSGDVIELPTMNCSITLTTGELSTDLGDISLVGNGASPFMISGGGQSRIFNHTGNGTLSLMNVTLARGFNYAPTAMAKGGCLYSASSVYLYNVTLTNCLTRSGTNNALGGGASANRMNVKSSRVVGNSAEGLNTAGGGGLNVESDLSMYGSTIANNDAEGAYAQGGGVRVKGQFAINGSTISGNQGALGAGAMMYANGVMENSTVSSNISEAAVGGMVIGGNASIFDSTIVFNHGVQTAVTFPAGVFWGACLVEFESTIAFGNVNGPMSYDIGTLAAGTGQFTGANNLIGTSTNVVLTADTLHSDPLLGPLQDNGGPTLTHALLPGSPAIDAGNSISQSPSDQRGFPRVVGPAADIGAFEVQITDRIFADGFD